MLGSVTLARVGPGIPADEWDPTPIYPTDGIAQNFTETGFRTRGHMGGDAWSRSYYLDADGDGMPDGWESRAFGTTTRTATEDADGDGLNNAGEFAWGWHPLDPDTDRDGLNDNLEGPP
jgi:hypothetical protein